MLVRRSVVLDRFLGKEALDMSSVSMMTDTDNKMMSLAVVHGITAPSQTSHAVGGLAGASEASGALTPLLKPISGLSDFLADYIDSKNRFEAELRTTLQEARKAAASMETMEYAQAERKERTTETAEAVSEPKTDKDSVGTVETFADRYNNLTEFLKENKDVSERASSITSALKDASRSVGAFSAIGITADANGKLHVNATRLAASLKDRPESVEYVLGKGGLAGRAQKSIKLATFNQDKLFPSVSYALGREDNPAKSMYSSKAVAAQNDFKARGSMLNLYS